MVYLKNFYLLNELQEYGLICDKKNIHNNLYPFKIFPYKELEEIVFEPITILYGGNGSGKTTILNIISDKINANKRNLNFKGELFESYVRKCGYTLYKQDECKEIKFISSDDVFDYLLDLRAINSNVNRRKEELSEEYLNYKYSEAKDYMTSINQYDELKNKVDANRMTISKYIRTRLGRNNFIQESNGETALDFWENEIKDNAIYIIDEPENSLSAENQLKLKKYIEDSARFYNCQFIIATHSPFLLGVEYAKVYDLDEVPAVSKKWTELKNVQVYYNFFKENENEFK